MTTLEDSFGRPYNHSYSKSVKKVADGMRGGILSFSSYILLEEGNEAL